MKNYEKLLDQLDILIQNGQGESPEADILIDQMSVIWDDSDVEEKSEIVSLTFEKVKVQEVCS